MPLRPLIFYWIKGSYRRNGLRVVTRDLNAKLSYQDDRYFIFSVDKREESILHSLSFPLVARVSQATD